MISKVDHKPNKFAALKKCTEREKNRFCFISNLHETCQTCLRALTEFYYRQLAKMQIESDRFFGAKVRERLCVCVCVCVRERERERERRGESECLSSMY